MPWQISVPQYHWDLIRISSLCKCVNSWKTWTQGAVCVWRRCRFYLVLYVFYIIALLCTCAWMVLYALCVYQCVCFISVCQLASMVHKESSRGICCEFAESMLSILTHTHTRSIYCRCTVMMHLGSTEAAR